MRCSWLVEVALVALPDLYGYRQVFTLCDYDLCPFDGAKWLLECHWQLVGSILMTTMWIWFQRVIQE